MVEEVEEAVVAEAVEEAVVAEAVVAEAVEEAVVAEAVVAEAVEEALPPHNHHNHHSSNRMLHQLQMSKQWESFPTRSTATEQKQRISSKKSKDTSISIKT